WLAPILDGPQSWMFVDRDAALIGTAMTRTARWAAARGYALTFPRRAMIVHTPSGAWRIETPIRDIASRPEPLPLRTADAVVCSALLDLVSAAWIGRLVALLRAPLLATLTVDRSATWRPRHRSDGLITAGFQRDQMRNKGFGPALGPHAPSA